MPLSPLRAPVQSTFVAHINQACMQVSMKQGNVGMNMLLFVVVVMNENREQLWLPPVGAAASSGSSVRLAAPSSPRYKAK